MAVHHTSLGGPCVNRVLHPGWHRNGPHASVFADEIDDAPAVVALLDMAQRQRCDFGAPESATEEYGEHVAIPEPLLGLNVWSVE